MSELKAGDLWRDMQEDLQSGAIFQQALAHGRAYLREAYDRHVAPSQSAIDALDAFHEPLPEKMGDPAAIIDQLHIYGSPGTIAQTGGRFFGLVNGSIIPTGLAARLLADMWDQNAALFAISPVNGVVEEVCENWLRELLGLPENTRAGFVSGTSMALVCGLAAARWRLCQRAGYDINAGGLAGAPRLRIVTGRHAHSTVIKAISLLGFGTDNIEWVDVDSEGRLRSSALPPLDDRTILLLQAGNVNSGAFDPLRTAGEAANKAGAWTHIDGAFGLWAAASTSLRSLTDGLELAQSWSLDGHKTLNTPYDNGISLCIDEEAITGALQNTASYIMFSENRDGMRYTPEMSRRARGIELWATLKYLGREGVDRLVSTLHVRAKQFADELNAAGFDVVNAVHFNQVMIRIGDAERTNAFVAAVQASGETWVGASRWFDAPIVRISVSSWATTSEDVTRAVSAFRDALSTAD